MELIKISSKHLFSPRRETIYWVKKAIKQISKSKTKKIKVLDLFAGSGIIGILVLKNIKNSVVHFGEIDKNALKAVKENLEKNKIGKKRYKIIKTNVFSNIKEKYNFILANPPYIAPENRFFVQESVLKNEPKRALFSKDKGLYHIKKLIIGAKKHLKEGGALYFEFDHYHKNLLENFLKEQENLKYKICKDQFKKFRYCKVLFFD
ncbi:50S ribosomal protein L3 glutamine methyltransferase [bacterium HR34]|nr:50S ribosomal protein L3 glutamine methyltransferase [bacterium HR34]